MKSWPFLSSFCLSFLFSLPGGNPEFSNKIGITTLILSLFSLSWSWENISLKPKASPEIKMQTQWVVDTNPKQILKPQLTRNSPPLITKNFVIQGARNSITAYQKETGQIVWNKDITQGVASPILLHKQNLYFGGSDGFFYSLQLKTGQLNWKFFTGSENAGPPLIHENQIYWSTADQKLYALSLKGARIWIYSGPSLSGDFVVQGRPRPAIYKDLIYIGFYDGSLLALSKNTGRLKWKLQLSSQQPIREDLEATDHCLFVPVFDSYLFCLDPKNGTVQWKVKGGQSSQPTRKSVAYQYHRGRLYALNKKNGQELWQKQMGMPPLAPLILKDYLIYGFPSRGELIIARARDGKTLWRHTFGRGLAAPVRADQNDIYFLSLDGYLHKISLLY